MHHIIFVMAYLSLMSCQLVSSQGPERANPEILSPAKGMHTLLQKQKQEFPSILAELKREKKKTNHWIWWVFPTDKPGQSEPLPKTDVPKNKKAEFLTQADLDLWCDILEEILSLLATSTQKEQILPSIDWGRIKMSVSFWLEEPTIQNHPRFYQAMIQFRRFTTH